LRSVSSAWYHLRWRHEVVEHVAAGAEVDWVALAEEHAAVVVQVV
jgi:hypothetical protein